MSRTPSHKTVFADTNLFFECKKLEKLPWEVIASDHVDIFLTEPVLGEIDKHKRGSGRTRARALDVFKRVREMLETQANSVVICNGTPTVNLHLQTDLPISDGLAARLDMTKPDNRLCALTAEYLRNHPDVEIILLTHDSGPAATSRTLGVPFRLIPDSWLRPAPLSPDQKRASDMEAELSRYRQAEPNFVFEDTVSKEIDLRRTEALPLSEAECDKLVDNLKLRCPFLDPLSQNIEDGFEPPSDSFVAKYKDEYAAWLNRCRSTFKTLHESYERNADPVSLEIAIQNTGSRPASSAKVSFLAQGDFIFMRPLRDEDDPQGRYSPSAPIVLPNLERPPQPPEPKLKPKPSIDVRVVSTSAAKPFNGDIASLTGISGAASVLRSMESPTLRMLREDQERRDRLFSNIAGLGTARSVLGDAMKAADPFGLSLIRQDYSVDFPGPVLNTLSPHNRGRRKETFYYGDDWNRYDETKSGLLTCELWRHAKKAECFEIVLRPNRDAMRSGRLLIRVDAANLTEPKEQTVKVLMEPMKVDTYAKAMELIENL